MFRHERCPGCGATGQTTGLYCHECGAAVTYEDKAAEARQVTVAKVKGRFAYLVQGLVALGLLAALAAVLLYSWGNRAAGSTVVLLEAQARLEAEDVAVEVGPGWTVRLPGWPCRGPLTLRVRYALSPPDCRLRLRVLRGAEPPLWEGEAPLRFLTGRAEFEVPLAELGSRPPFELDFRQDDKPVARWPLVVEEARP